MRTIHKFSLILAGAAFAVAATTATVFASASDYAFEAVNSELAKSADATVTVRLVHKPTGKPVANALIIRTRLDMGPDGMADMAVPVQAVPATEPGIYAFKADLSMSGRWQLSVAAKVQGEPETVMSKLILTVRK